MIRWRDCICIFLVFKGVFTDELKAQVTAGFVRNDAIPVVQNSQTLTKAWAGGMNFLQYSQIDLNQDGIKDLFVFDRSGNKITTYINNGTPNQVDYVLAPQYVYQFPLLHDWVLLRDYNCDGKEDIFTYSVAGFSIFENTSTIASGLQFQLREFLVLTDRSPNSSHFMGNLFVSQVDIPAIRDVDSDGDLDVLTFSNSGTQVEYHRNMSVERYGICDSIEYIVESNCWGTFSENSLNAGINLNVGCLPPPIQPDLHYTERNARHAGSCLECINIDGDSTQDLLIGDLGSPHVALLINAGSPATAYIDSVVSQYPAGPNPVNKNIFVCPFFLDVNNDSKRDLLFSPAAPNTSENYRSSTYYMNTGSDSAVQAQFITDGFLQQEMIDVGEGAYPVLFDYDDDGDLDLLIGNRGYYSSSGQYPSMIALYKNTGTPLQPSFILQNDDFAGIYANGYGLSNLAPTFGDLDGDGDEDMLIGDGNGQVHYFRKDAGNAENFVLAGGNYQGIDVGSYATPFLTDIDRDGKLDLLIGEQSGNVNYYRNTGTTSNATFTSITSAFGGIDIRQPGWFTGYSSPVVFEDNNVYSILVGSERGWIYRYDNVEGNLAGNFTLTDSMYVSWREGGQTSPAIGDLTGDGLYDMIIGNYAGGVSFFLGDSNVSVHQNDLNVHDAISVVPNPGSGLFTITLNENDNSGNRVRIFDLSGRMLMEKELIQPRTDINLEQFSDGTYICEVTFGDGRVKTSKIILRK